MAYYIILILIVFGLGFWVWKLYQDKGRHNREIALLEKEKDEIEGFGKGLEEYNKKMQGKKQAAKQKIMRLFENKEKVNNSDAAKALGVSRNTIVRYLDELETDGMVKQVGKVGQAVFYRKI